MKKKDFKLVSHIAKSIKRTYEDMKNSSGKEPETKDSFWDQYKIKLRKKKMPTALRAVYYKDKFSQFFGKDEDKAKDPDKNEVKPSEVAAANADDTAEKLSNASNDGKVTVAGRSFDEVDVAVSGARWQAFAAAEGGDDEAMGDHVGDAVVGGGMGSGFHGASGPAGFGLGDFGLVAFGEAVNRNMRAARAFISTSGLEGDALAAVENGYKLIFQSVIEGETAVLFGFQPSLRDYMAFDVDALVFALNSYGGHVVSVFVGEASGAEPEDALRAWYEHIGIRPEVIANMTFVEKANEVAVDTMLDIEPSGDTSTAFVLMNDVQMRGFAAELHEPRLMGCADTYLMGDFMASLAAEGVKFEIDRRFLFLV